MKILKWISIILVVLVSLPILLFAVIYIGGSFVSYQYPEEILEIDSTMLVKNEDVIRYADNSLRKNKYGIWEMYLEGRPEERGVAYGAMAKDLIRYQEKTFIDKIQSLIPSGTYLSFLRRVVMFANRSIDEYIPEEVRSEVYNMSQVCSSEYDQLVGDAYSRQLNYHAAHDIGHAMQQYMLVGCSAFSAWDKYSLDSTMIVGRNFDFYFGEEFAHNKMIVFTNPTEGIPFVSVSWPAMMGVVSGMNMEGITVTLNAAEGELSIIGKTPVSVLARQIVQYATSIDEAIAIAEQTETFVSEQIFVCSAKERKALIIEKSPKEMSVVINEDGIVSLTNHYTSGQWQIEPREESVVRLSRLEQLLHRAGEIDQKKALEILRDYRDNDENPLPIGSEKALCQFISHHSVIFKPDSLQMWVSTAPWQLGDYVCYDLKRIIEQRGEVSDYTLPQMTLPADSIMIKMYNDKNK